MTGSPFRFATANVGSGVRSLDRVAVVERDGGLAIVLADGAGGMGGGGFAAEAAVEGLLRVDDWASWPDSGGLAAASHLDALDRRLALDAHGGQCAVVAVGFFGGHEVGASVGDSGAWCGGSEGPTDLTRAQHRKPLLGSGGAVAVAFASVPTGRRLLIASDGLFRYAPHDALWTVATGGSVDEAAARLVELVRLPRGSLRDDVSIVVVDLPGRGPRALAIAERGPARRVNALRSRRSPPSATF